MRIYQVIETIREGEKLQSENQIGVIFQGEVNGLESTLPKLQEYTEAWSKKYAPTVKWWRVIGIMDVAGSPSPLVLAQAGFQVIDQQMIDRLKEVE